MKKKLKLSKELSSSISSMILNVRIRQFLKNNNMTKLEKLYSIIENSKELGLQLGEDVLRQTSELEENIIKKEILPVLTVRIIFSTD